MISEITTSLTQVNSKENKLLSKGPQLAPCIIEKTALETIISGTEFALKHVESNHLP